MVFGRQILLISLIILPAMQAQAFKTEIPGIGPKETREYYQTMMKNTTKMLEKQEALNQSQVKMQAEIKQLSSAIDKNSKILNELKETLSQNSNAQEQGLEAIAKIITQSGNLQAELLLKIERNLQKQLEAQQKLNRALKVN